MTSPEIPGKRHVSPRKGKKESMDRRADDILVESLSRVSSPQKSDHRSNVEGRIFAGSSRSKQNDGDNRITNA